MQPPRLALAELFTRLSSPAELRSFISRLPGGSRLESVLPDSPLPMAELAARATDALIRMGMVDASLFEALAKVMPSHVRQVEEVARAWNLQLAPEATRGAPHAPETRFVPIRHSRPTENGFPAWHESIVLSKRGPYRTGDTLGRPGPVVDEQDVVSRAPAREPDASDDSSGVASSEPRRRGLARLGDVFSSLYSGIVGRSSQGENRLHPEPYSVLAAYPRLFAKRNRSVVRVSVAADAQAGAEERSLRREVESQKGARARSSRLDLLLERGQTVELGFDAPDFEVSAPKRVTAAPGPQRVRFQVKPNEACPLGPQVVFLTVKDVETGRDIGDAQLEFDVTDYVFDHVSRPALSVTMTVVLNIGALAGWGLGLAEQVDATLGLAGGTAAGALGLWLGRGHWLSFMRPTRSSGAKMGGR